MYDKLQLVVREISETNLETTFLVRSVTALPVAFTWSETFFAPLSTLFPASSVLSATSRPRAIGACSSSL